MRTDVPQPQNVGIAVVSLFVLYMSIRLYRGQGSIARAYRKWGIPASIRRAIAFCVMVIVLLGFLGTLAADLGIFPATPVAG
jgi:multisubunit Na+/H+ antiporter MnhF subunit